MVLLKSCPRCHGDLATDWDNVLSCIQCGNEPSVVQLPMIPFTRGK